MDILYLFIYNESIHLSNTLYMVQKKRQKSFKKQVLASKSIYFTLVGVALVLVLGIVFLFYALANQANKTTVTQASDNTDVQAVIDDFYSRVPAGQELLPLSERQTNAGLPKEKQRNSAETVNFVVNIPGESGSYPPWTSEDGSVKIEGRSWTGIYDIFPLEEVDRLISDERFSKSELLYILEERQKALKLYLSRFYGYILNDTLFGKYRVEINSFADEIPFSNRLTSQLNQKGVQKNALSYQPKVVEACLFLEKGYKQLDVIIDRNIGGSDNAALSARGFGAFTGYGKASDEDVQRTTDAIEQVHTLLRSCSTSDATIRMIYMNEIDLLNVYAHNSTDDYGTFPIVKPDEYAESYYKIAAKLARKQIIFAPGTFYMGYMGYFWGARPEENNGLNPWIESMAKYQYLKYELSGNEQSYVHDYLATNDYKDTAGWKEKIDKINTHIEKANRKHNARITFSRIQEFGILPQQPVPRQYQANLTNRKELIPQLISHFAYSDATLFSKPGLALSPSDGEVPATLLYGQENPFNMGFLYRDEPGLWPLVRDSLNSVVSNGTVDQPRRQDDHYFVSPTASPPEEDVSITVNCPQEALDAGVENTCGERVWRGCYCDTNINMYVNSCGPEGQEEYKETQTACVASASPVETGEPSGECTKEAPNEAIANEGQFQEAIQNHCFVLDTGGYATCSHDGPHNQTVTCDWCFGGYCLNKE